MKFDIDSVLIDRVFQPAADRLAAWASCFGLARVCLVGAALFQFVVLANDLQADDDGLRRALAGGITILALVGADQGRHVIKRAERQSRSGMMNIRRMTMRWQRVAWVVINVWAISMALGQPTGANVAVCLASMAWGSCIYFISCSPSPPVVRRTSRVLAFAR